MEQQFARYPSLDGKTVIVTGGASGNGAETVRAFAVRVHGLTRTMARDLGQHHIRVNAVVPGWIMTERQQSLWVTEEAIERQRLPTLIEPVYVARKVVFPASDDAATCSANNYMVEVGSI